MCSLELCKLIPKVELHAHLNGSIPTWLIGQLVDEQRDHNPLLKDVVFDPDGERDLAACFALFKVIHAVVQDAPTISRVAEQVIRDFAADGVRYLELRTTPRANAEKGLTKSGYVETVLEAIERVTAEVPITVHLLLSVDRSRSVEEAEDTVALANSFRSKGVIGVELSGNPRVGSFCDLGGALETARHQGLPVSLHFAETDNFEESNQMLDFAPDRLGHAAVLNNDLTTRLLALKIPVECCPTSNVKCGIASSYKEQVFHLLHNKCPLAISTDDVGVFNTTLSLEYHAIATAHGLTVEELKEMTLVSVDCVFDKGAKPGLRELFEEQWQSILLDQNRK